MAIKLNRAGTFLCIARKPEFIPPGKSWVVLSKTGTPSITIDYEVLEDGPCKGQVITGYHYLTEATMDRTLNALSEAFEFKGEFTRLRKEPELIAGKQCRIVTKEEEFEGKTSIKVQWLNSVNRIAGINIDEADKMAEALEARSKAVLAASGSKPESKPDASDDMPY